MRQERCTRTNPEVFGIRRAVGSELWPFAGALAATGGGRGLFGSA